MKTIEIKTDDAVGVITQFAERLRDLVLDAQDHGVQLMLPVPTPKAILAEDHPDIEQHIVSAAVPARYEHRFYNQVLQVQAFGIVDTKVLDGGRRQVVRARDMVFEPPIESNVYPDV